MGTHCELRRPTPEESHGYLLGDCGWIAHDGSRIVGHVAYNLNEGVFHIHSLATYDAPATLYARLRKRVIADARSLGFSEVRYYVMEPEFTLLRTKHKGRAQLVCAVFREAI